MDVDGKTKIARPMIYICSHCGHADSSADAVVCQGCGRRGWAVPNEVSDPMYALCDSMNEVQRLRRQIGGLEQAMRTAVRMLRAKLPEE